MKKRITCWLLVLALCLTAAVPALAANVFMFTEKTLTLFEGDAYQTELRREGSYDGDGELVYASGKDSVATVSQDGVITAVGKGRTEVSVSLMRNGKRVGNKAVTTVNVLRAVNKVTLNTTRLTVYDPYDPAVTDLLKEPTEHQVLVMPAGTLAPLAATCTPEDASNKKITFTTNDAGVAKVQGTSLKAIQRGECDLVVASASNPDVTETFRVLVIQPVKTITINAGPKRVAAGSQLQLSAVCNPDNASIPGVKWASKMPNIATVDEYGMVTGLKKGSATITATAVDGSNAIGTVTIQVDQPVSSVSFTQAEIQVIAGKTAMAKVTVAPADATNKTIVWSTSDESIATVRGNGQVVGVKAGVCTLYATSQSNPGITASTTVVVSQLVTGIQNANNETELTLKVGESVQTRWNILPDDATVTALTFTSRSPKIASVDENGYVTAKSRGVTNIVATAKDAGRRQGTAKVTVIQPVTGVAFPRARYYIQRGSAGNVTANIQPNNANNKTISQWYSSDESVATVRHNGTSTGRIYGANNGIAYITGVTEDGGFTATTEIHIGNYNAAVLVEELYVDADNRIRITMRNMTPDVTMGRINFTVECFDTDGYPFVCNKDGESLFFEASYPYLVGPYERTVHGSFNFGNYVIDRPLGAVVLTVTGWKDVDGFPYTIPESERIKTTWNRFNYIILNENTGEGEGVG